MSRTKIDTLAYPPRGLSRDEAARYIVPSRVPAAPWFKV